MRNSLVDMIDGDTGIEEHRIHGDAAPELVASPERDNCSDPERQVRNADFSLERARAPSDLAGGDIPFYLAAVGSTVAMWGWASSAWAEDAVPGALLSEVPASGREWSIILSPYVWGASVDGMIRAVGTKYHVRRSASQLLQDLDFEAMGRVEITNGEFGAYLDGQYVNLASKAVTPLGPARLGVTSSLASAGMFYRVYERLLDGMTSAGDPMRFVVEPTVGL